jgi:hypothetical protein
MKMFRFIHAADLHLDSPLRGLEQHEGAPIEVLRGATRRALGALVELAIREQAAFVVISGDVYDADWKDYSTGLFFRGQMARLCEKQIPVYLLFGNHDAASVISKKLTLPDNVHVFSTRSPESKELPDLNVVLHGRGFPNRAILENFAVDYPAALPGKLNIGLLHTSLNGRPGHDTYAPCSVDDLRGKNYSYWALGHIHQPEVVCEDPWVVYAGNSQGRHINESGPRGCWLVTINDLEVESVEFRELDSVRWASLNIDLSGVSAEPEALRVAETALTEAVKAADGRLVACRVVVSGATSLHGSLHREQDRWRAELLGKAQDHGEAVVWVEKIVFRTTPIYDVAELGKRDDLTRVVLESFTRDHSALELPDDVKEMMSLLPPEVRIELEEEWAESLGTVMADVRSIILDGLSTRGGQVL